MKKYILPLFLICFITGLCLANSTSQHPRKPKSSTDKRIKKQEKHRKKHPCPQIDC